MIPTARLPVDLAFLRRVDLSQINAFVIEEDLHVIKQELVRIRIRNIEAKVIDQLLLFLLPLGPAVFAHFRTDLLPELGRDRRETEGFIFLPTARALEFVTAKYCHDREILPHRTHRKQT